MPRQIVASIERVENSQDDYGIAVKVTLDCGHYFIATGDKIYNISGADCPHCGGSGEIFYYHKDAQKHA